MKSIIVGVGNSGTTLIYDLLIELYKHNLGHSAKFDKYYEPLFWKGENQRNLYPSEEGLSIHVNIPLVPDVNDNSMHRILLDSFFADLNGVAKFIRLGSRSMLIPDDVKVIVVIRNLINYMNSLAYMHRKYPEMNQRGGYHHFPNLRCDDSERVLDEFAKLEWEYTIHPNDRMTIDALWWYLHNRISYDATKERKNFMLLDYNAFCESPKEWTKTIATFLEIEYIETQVEMTVKKREPRRIILDSKTVLAVPYPVLAWNDKFLRGY